MDESILNSVKDMIAGGAIHEHFDNELIMHINSVIVTLRQIGIGPQDGFAIKDDTATWSDLIGDSAMLEAVKSYVGFKVRMMFDPPASSSVSEAIKENIKELEWRLGTTYEIGV